MRLAEPRWAAFILLVISVALYANTLGYAFVWDDVSLIATNRAVRTLDARAIGRIFTEGFAEVEGRQESYYRPLVTLSYHIDYALFHGNPAGFHAANVFWNAVTCVVVFAFVNLLFGNAVFAMVTATLFAAHPVHTESVAWISGRTDVLAALCSLVSLSCYVLARRRRNHLLMSASLFAFMLSMLAKESAVCLPLLILLLEFGLFKTMIAPHGRLSAAPEEVRTRPSIIYPIFFFGVLAGYLWLRHEAIGSVTSTHEVYAAGAVGYVALPLSILGGYVYKVLVPVKLSAEYETPVPTSFADLHVIAGFVIAAFVAWTIWRFRRRADVVFGVGVFVLGLVPVMNVIPIGEVSAERFLYFPSLGVALLLGGVFASALAAKCPVLQPRDLSRAYGGWRVSKPLAGYLVTVLVAVLLAFAVKTIDRNHDWKNERILFAKTAEQEPTNPHPHAAIADAAYRNGDIATAVGEYQKALKLKPDYWIGLMGLARIWAQQGRYDEALPLFAKTAEQEPTNPYPHAAMADAAYRNGDIPRAVREYQKVLEIDPDYPIGLIGLAQIWAQQGSYDKALPLVEKAIRATPDDPILNANLGFLYYKTNQNAKAMPYLEKALRLNPEELWAHFNLGMIHLQQKNFVPAREHFERAVQGGADFNMANYYLAVIENAEGNDERAKEFARAFLALYATDDRFRREAEAIVRGEPHEYSE